MNQAPAVNGGAGNPFLPTGKQPNGYFYLRSTLNAARTAQAGRPVHEGVVYVMIRHPGERDCIDRPASEEDKARFPQQWAAFSQNMTQVPDGTPLDILFPLNPEVAANLRGQGVHTVEQLAALSGEALNQVGMGSKMMQTRAQKFLASASKGVEFHQMQSELKGRDEKIAALEESLKMAQAQLSRLIAAQEQRPAAQPAAFTTSQPYYVASPAAWSPDDLTATAEQAVVETTEPAPQPRAPGGRAGERSERPARPLSRSARAGHSP
jgi:hypothetical protein